MDETTWRTATDPTPMLAFLRESGKASERKLRLFAVACCRRVWPLLTDERSRKAVEAAEGFTNGLVTAGQLRGVRAAAHDVFFSAKLAEYQAEAEGNFCDSVAYSRVCATLYTAAAARVALSPQAFRSIDLLAAYERNESRWRTRQDRANGCRYWLVAAVGRAERARQYQAAGMADDVYPPREVRGNPDGVVLPGMFVRIRVPLGEPYKALLLPGQAIGTDQGRKFVYVVNEKNVVETRPVTLGPQEGDLVAVKEGLKAGDRIAVSELGKLRPGMKVKPREVEPGKQEK